MGDDAKGLVIAGRRLQRNRSGGVRLRLTPGEQELLGGLAAELRHLLADDADRPDLVRLFPPAYADDPKDESEYRELMHDELLAGRRETLRVFSDSLEQDELTEMELDAWLRVLNDLRLVLGTRLDVSEAALVDELDRADPQAPELALYGYLSWLQEQAVEAASAGLSGR